MTRRKDDGVRIVREPGVRGSVWLLVAALGLLAAVALLILRPARQVEPHDEDVVAMRSEVPVKKSAASRRPAAPERPAAKIVPVRRHNSDSDVVQPPAEVTPPEPQATPAADQEDAGAGTGDGGDERTGIALFPPPGTDPLKPGILVPEDFTLPEGFVRHYQATDTGQRVPAILMFHPDYEFFDAQGNRVEIPESRIVPPELAPPGMPVEMLTPPDDTVPMLETEDGKPPALE